MAPAQPAYAKDERVLCFHQELLYEANILDVRLEDPKDKKGPHEYKVHYRGWKKTWDGWVPQDRLKKWSEENQELAKTLKKEMETLTQAARGSKSSASSKKKGDSSARDSEERAIAGRKRGRDYDTEKEEAYQSKPAIRIIMPDVLKSILVDDWENITKNLQLVHVPAEEYTVATILQEYHDYERAHRGVASAAANILEEIIAGLIEYFNKSLGRLLLYRFERGQYEDVLARVNKSGDELEGKALANIYGCEHLLRLLVSLPELIAQTNMDQQSVTRLREELHGLTTWLSRQENINKYLSTPYENQGSEYQERMDVIPKSKAATSEGGLTDSLIPRRAISEDDANNEDVSQSRLSIKNKRASKPADDSDVPRKKSRLLKHSRDKSNSDEKRVGHEQKHDGQIAIRISGQKVKAVSNIGSSRGKLLKTAQIEIATTISRVEQKPHGDVNSRNIHLLRNGGDSQSNRNSTFDSARSESIMTDGQASIDACNEEQTRSRRQARRYRSRADML